MGNRRVKREEEEEEEEGAVLTLPPPFAKRAGRRQLLGAAPVPRRCRSLLKSVQCTYFFYTSLFHFTPFRDIP